MIAVVMAAILDFGLIPFSLSFKPKRISLLEICHVAFYHKG